MTSKIKIQLYNNDCLSVLKELKDESIDLILTDPPYNLGKFMKDRQTNLKKCVKIFWRSWVGRFRIFRMEEPYGFFFEEAN
ncbi:hypothetical protein [Piscibacillus salipiscarius]|uniref:hypothetical protein n=1 Tax=Piscibacillus salipiscarius TaxID=299480 RepID=UPI00243718A3|nr:hypothetical protein [Piscibacillus salipiscarius]